MTWKRILNNEMKLHRAQGTTMLGKRTECAKPWAYYLMCLEYRVNKKPGWR